MDCSLQNQDSANLRSERNVGLIFTALCIYPWADRIDVTAQSEDTIGVAFAPALDMRFASLDWRERREMKRRDELKRYQEEVQQTRARSPDVWEELLARPLVTLVCYCTRATRCHRVLLAEMLAEHGALYQGERPQPYDGPLDQEPANPRGIERPRGVAALRRSDSIGLASLSGQSDSEP